MAVELDGLGVLVTRPKDQAQKLCQLIEQSHGKVYRLPVLEIMDTLNPEAVAHTLSRLHEFDLAVFISANAVRRGMDLIKAKVGQLPKHLQVATIGTQSAQALREYGVEEIICPSAPFNSETLLAMEPMRQVKDKKIVIFRGEGGREMLANELRQRGAIVEYAQIYRRARPNVDTTEIIDQWAQAKIGAVTVTSNEGLQNLYDMLGEKGQHWLRQTALVVVSDRAKELAKEMGIVRVVVAKLASDDAIISALSALGT